MNDHIYRWVPKGMQVYALGNDAPAGAEVWISEKESGFSAIAYSGRRGRYDWHYSFRSRARMVQEIEQFLVRIASVRGVRSKPSGPAFRRLVVFSSTAPRAAPPMNKTVGHGI